MILVTLGTQDKSFTRLLDALEKQLEKGTIKDKVIVQAGYTKYESKYMEIFDLIEEEELEKLIKKADLIITHGGVGSILSGIRNNKKVIAASRLAKYKEHTNDHQKQIVKELAKEGYILELRDFDSLEKLIKKAETFVPKKFESNTDNIVKTIEKFIEDNPKLSLKEKIMKHKEVLLYLVFGVLTTIVSLATYFILMNTLFRSGTQLEIQISNIISWIISVTFAYFTNRKFVFASKNGNLFKEALSFYSSRLLSLGFDMLIMWIGTGILLQSDSIVKLFSQVIVIILNYILSKWFVFK